jgi:formamidopyrimidine-DNA glycosylase
LPELPEVEVVRRGLEAHVAGRTIHSAEVFHPRAVRRHTAGPGDFEDSLRGMTVVAARRRGKYLWLPLAPGEGARGGGTPSTAAGAGTAGTASGGGAGETTSRGGAGLAGGPSVAEDALLAHLGMSGQLVLGDPDRPLSPHVRARFTFTDSGPDLRFTDQRTFGHLMYAPGGADLPAVISHIAPDPLEPAYDEVAVIAKLRTRHTGIKVALLDQSLVSGVGNIYADEALWRAKIHWARPAASLRRADAASLLAAVREVLSEALAAGGTSFDSLYINVNGESGYFGRSLAVYGRLGEPCPRCGTPVRRDPFANRSAYSCPVCQPRPRSRGTARDLRRRST